MQSSIRTWGLFLVATLLSHAVGQAGVIRGYNRYFSGPNADLSYRYSDRPATGSNPRAIFGRNHYGQLALPIASDSMRWEPATLWFPERADTAIDLISAGARHTVFVTTGSGNYSNPIFVAGSNLYGELGVAANAGTPTPTSVPVKLDFPAADSILGACAGGDFTIVYGYKVMYSFGNNFYGQLGRTTNAGTNNPNHVPTQVPKPSGVKHWYHVTAGAHHVAAIAIKTDNTYALYAWGSNRYGQLGIATHEGTDTPVAEPVEVPLPEQPWEVHAGADFTIVRSNLGKLWSFGRNRHGQLGHAANSGTDLPNSTAEQIPFPAGENAVYKVAAGGEHVLVIFYHGASDNPIRTLFSFGSNRYGQLGYATNAGTDNPNRRPTAVPGIPAATADAPNWVAAGRAHSLVSTLIFGDGGSVSAYHKAFGHNRYGQLGSPVNVGSDMVNDTPIDIIPTTTGIPEEELLPAGFALEQNYPNPFNPSSVIEFTVGRSGPARLTIIDALGRELATAFEGQAAAGRVYRVSVDASGLASGVYFYRLTAGGDQRIRRMVVLR